MTKAAVAAYQTSKGIAPAAGYVGPLTRAAINADAAVVTTTTGGTTTTTGTGITTVGKEGTISVTNTAAGLASSAYEGDTMVPVLAFKVEAQNSDLSVQRVKIDFGTTTSTIQNKIYSKFYVTDGSNVLATVNSSDAVKDSSNSDKYALAITGFNFLVKSGETKTLTIKADVYGTVDSTKLGSYTLALSSQGVRAVDGAGIDQYDGGSSVSRSVQIKKDLAESAEVVVSTNSSTPDATQIIAADGSSNNEKDGVTLLTFDLQAKKDSVKVTDLQVAAAASTGAATLQTVYLYDGSTQLDSATLSGGVATFSNIDLMISKDSTKSLTVKADVRNAGTTVTTWSATTTAAYITAENSKGDSVTNISGSASGNAMSFLSVGPELSLVSKSATGSKRVVTTGGGDVATSTQDYTFSVNVKAVGGALVLGASGSTTPAFGTSSSYVKVYNGSSDVTSQGGLTVSYFKPSSGVVESGSGATATYTIAEGQSATFDVTYSLSVGTSTAGSYSIGLAGVKANNVFTNYMSGLSAWRTAGVQLP